ncbi:SURP and G-patch domain-containing protein 2 isoform X2 [Hyla sarda]|uniref:SURP and G-patch domain-containing protein 2 isoform X2 n=1 Tax=Hyla sarda TaxID=327740 RepID=UPI0024C41FE1|nr:SURP and G-patch domain-containing protein 2 isoform X2 [Hyla sarda]
MAGQRMTRETFDALVQEKMKRYRLSMDQAMSDTLRELEGSSSTRRSINDNESVYRDKQRYSMRDSGSLDRSWDMEMRGQPYRRELDREPGGRNLDTLLDRWGSADPMVKERMFREELNAADRRFSELEDLRREELFARDLNLNRRNWELDRPHHEADLAVGRSEMFRDFHPQNSLGPVNIFKSQGPMGQVPIKRRGNKAGVAVTKASPASGNKPSDLAIKLGTRLIKWAKFNSRDDLDLLRQQKALLEVSTDTDTLDMIWDSFKILMTPQHRTQCFSNVRASFPIPLKSPKIDNDLLDLLIRTKTVTIKDDFFKLIKPFDKEMMIVQQYLLECAIPLVRSSNMFELMNSFLTDPRELFDALRGTVSLCQKSLVLIGQTFALISNSRQNNILDVLGLPRLNLKPSESPNYKNHFLFGNEFISHLREWLKVKGNKFTLKSKLKVPENIYVAKKKEVKPAPAPESQEKKVIDPKVVAAIDQLLENAKKENKADKEKSEFWFLFDENSNEYTYYRQKFAEFQNSKGHIQVQSTQTKKCKRTPEELACESVRAMLYARKVQALKKRLRRTLAFSKKRKQTKLKSRRTKASPSVKVEEIIKTEEQELEVKQTKEIIADNSACEVDVETPKTPDECSKTDTTIDEKEKVPEIKAIDPMAVDVDEKTQDTAIKLAQFVAQMGPEIEQFSMENSVNNPEFWFLCDKESPAYKFYKSKVEEFKAAEEEATSDEEIGLEDSDLENIRTGDELQNDSDVEVDAECEAAEAPSIEATPVAAFSQMPTPARPPIARKRVANLKVGMLPPKRVCLVKEHTVHDPVRIDYERPRGRGYNKRKKPVDLEFANKKLTQQNVGFQMLSKMGWQEGEGLGSQGSGIKNPINVGTISGGEGLGAEEKKAGNSANFDAFRQRMIQMYNTKKKVPNKKMAQDY